MSMKKWRTLAEKKAAVEQQNEKILTAMKNKAIEKKFGQLSGEEVFKPLTRRFDRAFTAQKDTEEVPDYALDAFDAINPFDGDFRPDEETPPVTPPLTPDAETFLQLPVPDYSIAESDQDFEDDTPESTPPPTPTSSPVPTLAEGEDDDDDDATKGGVDDDATKGDDDAKEGDAATPPQDLSQSVERAKWGTPQNPGIQGSESTDLQVLNSMLTKNKDNPDYVVKSPKSKYHGYTIPDIQKARDAILEKRGEMKAKSSSVFEKEPPDQEGSGVVDVNALVDRLYISLEKYNNNKFKWKKKSDSDWIDVTIPDGMYDYKDLNDAFQTLTGKTDDSKDIFELYFYTTTYRVTILIANDYELDLREGDFSDLIGFEKKILNDANNVGDHVPNLTRGVDWIYVHCDLVSRAVDNIEDDVLYTLSTSTLQISYPFSKEPRRLLWHPVNKYRINSIRIRISDGLGNDLFLNDQPVALSIFIEEEE
ncbi:hypothetical protein ACROYT_G010394 [Oculina patagonica]